MSALVQQHFAISLLTQNGGTGYTVMNIKSWSQCAELGNSRLTGSVQGCIEGRYASWQLKAHERIFILYFVVSYNNKVESHLKPQNWASAYQQSKRKYFQVTEMMRCLRYTFQTCKLTFLNSFSIIKTEIEKYLWLFVEGTSEMITSWLFSKNTSSCSTL